MNRYAIDVIGHDILKCGEILPIAFENYDYSWFNCLTILDDVLDNDLIQGKKSEHLPDHWSEIWKWEFRRDRIVEIPPVFRISEIPLITELRIFCTEQVIDIINENNLTGFDAILLWSIDAGGVMHPESQSATKQLWESAPREMTKKYKAKRRRAHDIFKQRQALGTS